MAFLEILGENTESVAGFKGNGGQGGAAGKRLFYSP